ncbi:hypothetical protein [Spiroplasma endosymbiont of Virgichneumon dumeticola]|uniref:hypothetical protein n=1 Tax=Spiroplasma endosymbiont of Virgichneumon dumeticola TaxID=3139323 RepID=UPI0035C93A86
MNSFNFIVSSTSTCGEKSVKLFWMHHKISSTTIKSMLSLWLKIAKRCSPSLVSCVKMAFSFSSISQKNFCDDS